MEFSKPYFFIIGILGIIGWYLTLYRPGKKAQIYYSNTSAIKKNYLSKHFIAALGFLGWILISTSLTLPRKAIGLSNNKIKVNDIFFVVDVSRSMLAEDFRPNRLEAAKQKILEFVNLKPADRIGIIMFSERAFTLLPLSTDLELIKRIVDEIKVGFLGMGTNIGDALALAVARGAQSLADNKAIVLLTDGVSNVGSMTPSQAAQEAAKKGIRVYTIGIGGSRDAKIPLGGSSFGRKRYQTIPGGSIDTKTLKSIARLTGGKDFIAQDSDALKDVLNEINNLERTEIDASSRILYKELYLDFLLYGLLLISIAEISRISFLKEEL
jgi:Ca-activated chloride channel family protein